MEQGSFYKLSYYTLAHSDPSFIHQHVVDAFGAQTSTEADKPIKLAFALVGLYLLIEKKYTGRQVQQTHMKLANRKQAWPLFSFPQIRGEITVEDVLQAAAGPDRDAMIHQWCISVWDAFVESRPIVEKLLKDNELL